MNYAEYMNAENGNEAHRTFYNEVAQDAKVKVSDKLIKETREAIAAGDEHLNTIPLKRWDDLAEAWRHRISPVLKERGTAYSISQGVCTMKAAARSAALK